MHLDRIFDKYSHIYGISLDEVKEYEDVIARTLQQISIGLTPDEAFKLTTHRARLDSSHIHPTRVRNLLAQILRQEFDVKLSLPEKVKKT